MNSEERVQTDRTGDSRRNANNGVTTESDSLRERERARDCRLCNAE